jgi:hypothetical protein
MKNESSRCNTKMKNEPALYWKEFNSLIFNLMEEANCVKVLALLICFNIIC